MRLPCSGWFPGPAFPARLDISEIFVESRHSQGGERKTEVAELVARACDARERDGGGRGVGS